MAQRLSSPESRAVQARMAALGRQADRARAIVEEYEQKVAAGTASEANLSAARVRAEILAEQTEEARVAFVGEQYLARVAAARTRLGVLLRDRPELAAEQVARLEQTLES